ncbi:MAG: type II toxin-antitoxin system Phd/YefM family antitoxin [Micromonosporaceae bacterium]
MKTLPLSHAKAHLSEIADEVDRTHERVLLTRNGRDYVVLMSAEDLESIEETLTLLADPDAQSRIRNARQEIAHGEYVTADEVGALMAERRRRAGER